MIPAEVVSEAAPIEDEVTAADLVSEAAPVEDETAPLEEPVAVG